MSNTTHDTSTAKATKGQLSLGVVFSAIRRYPIAFLLLLILAGTTATLVWIYLPTPKFTAAMVYRFHGQGPRVISPVLDNQMDVGTYGRRQSTLIKQRAVFNAVLNDPEAKAAGLLNHQSNPLAWLQSNLQVDFRGGAEYMRVYLEGDQPDDMVAILKAVDKAYKATLALENDASRKERIATLDTTHLQDEIRSKQKRIDFIAQALKTTDGATLALIDSLLHDELRGARKELLDLQQQMEFTKAEIQPLEAPQQPVVIPPQIVEEALRKDPTILAAEAKVSLLKQYVAEVESRFENGTTNPIVLKARGELKAAEQKRDALKSEQREQFKESLARQYDEDQKNTLLKLKDKLQQLERRKAVLEQQMKEIIDRINQHGDYRVELDKLRKEIGHQERLITTMAEEKERIRVEERAPNRVVMQDEPFVVEGAEGNRRLKMSSLSGGGLFILGFALLVRWEHRARRVSNPDELVKALGLPLLGTMPSLATNNDHSREDLIESIDSARTLMLNLRTRERPFRTVMITSALPGEGKTTLSGHLAISLARAGFRTVLVDGDLHRHSISTLFERENSIGLCELLRGEAEMADTIQTTEIPRLSVLPSGFWSLVTRQALVAERWPEIKKQLEEQFDFVVVDTGPFLMLADTQLMTKDSDGVIISSLIGVSRFGAVVQTHARLGVLGARILGAIVHGVRQEFSGGYYGSYSYYRKGKRATLEQPAATLQQAES